MRRLIFAVCLLVAGFGGIGLGSSGHAVAAPSPCGKGSALCFVVGAAGSNWNLTLYGSKLQPGTYVSFSYQTTSGGSAGAMLVPKGGSITDTLETNATCPAISFIATANGTGSKGAPVTTTSTSPAIC